MFVAGVAVAGDTKEANGTVKSVAGNSFVVTDSAGKDLSFDLDKSTLVEVKGGGHKMDEIKADGKQAGLGDFLAAEQTVIVKYVEKDGKLVAKNVRVRGATVK